MSTTKENKIRKTVRKRYGKIAETGGTCGTSCCSESPSVSDYDKMSKIIGYSGKDLEAVPEGSNMALGCGNPQAIAKLKKGEVVLDLGSGGGLDCFLAAKKVGET
ncbi:MAG: arsenite methyltransferase, partial [bacterium]